jgi:hypothetical protein
MRHLSAKRLAWLEQKAGQNGHACVHRTPARASMTPCFLDLNWDVRSTRWYLYQEIRPLDRIIQPVWRRAQLGAKGCWRSSCSAAQVANEITADADNLLAWTGTAGTDMQVIHATRRSRCLSLVSVTMCEMQALLQPRCSCSLQSLNSAY